MRNTFKFLGLAVLGSVVTTGVKWKQLISLEKHPEYHELKCLADMKPQEVKPLFECNGFYINHNTVYYDRCF